MPNQSTEGVEVNNDVKSEQNKDTKQKDGNQTEWWRVLKLFKIQKEKDLLKQHEEKATQTDSEENKFFFFSYSFNWLQGYIPTI